VEAPKFNLYKYIKTYLFEIPPFQRAATHKRPVAVGNSASVLVYGAFGEPDLIRLKM
jgi:hypothetical protein